MMYILFHRVITVTAKAWMSGKLVWNGAKYRRLVWNGGNALALVSLKQHDVWKTGLEQRECPAPVWMVGGFCSV